MAFINNLQYFFSKHRGHSEILQIFSIPNGGIFVGHGKTGNALIKFSYIIATAY